MKHYRALTTNSNRYRRASRRLFIVAALLLLAVVVGSLIVHRSYTNQLRPVNSSDKSYKYVTIASGTPFTDIAQLLHDKGLIRSSDAFQWYVTSKGERDKLQAGTYHLSPSMSTNQIADKIVRGEIATDLVTILPGQTITEIRKTFITAGFKVTEVDAALQPGQYKGMSALADNPHGSTLEGFLYPDSYQKTGTTNPSQIVTEALTEMQSHLTTDVRNGFAAQGLSVYQGVTLASIVEKEVAKPTDRTQVAQVFISRLRNGMRLGSDVTVFYARSVNDNSYDTTANSGLPPGTIASVSEGSLVAASHPASSKWLYFVTGDNGVTHFSKTFEEHQQNVDKYCHKLCSQN
jgi:UPF0755 protein